MDVKDREEAFFFQKQGSWGEVCSRKLWILQASLGGAEREVPKGCLQGCLWNGSLSLQTSTLGNSPASFSSSLMVREKCPIKSVSFLFLLWSVTVISHLWIPHCLHCWKLWKTHLVFPNKFPRPSGRRSETGPSFNQVAMKQCLLKPGVLSFSKGWNRKCSLQTT